MKFDLPTAEELPLVYDAWAQSFRKSPFAGCVRNDMWDQVQRATISELLTRSTVVVAIADEGERRVIGYSVSEPGVLHWLYVKNALRRLGCGARLLEETTQGWTQFVYTHRTRVSDKFLRRASRREWIWDPVFARVRR